MGDGFKRRVIQDCSRYRLIQAIFFYIRSCSLSSYMGLTPMYLHFVSAVVWLRALSFISLGSVVNYKVFWQGICDALCTHHGVTLDMRYGQPLKFWSPIASWIVATYSLKNNLFYKIWQPFINYMENLPSHMTGFICMVSLLVFWRSWVVSRSKGT